MTSFVDNPFPISRHNEVIQRTFDRLILISSVGFALAAGSAISLAVATSLFGSTSPLSRTELENAAREFGVASAIYGTGFTSSVVAMFIPMSRLEQSPSIVTTLIVAPSFVLFLAPFWCIQWATVFFGSGMVYIFGFAPFGPIFLLGTLSCVGILLFVFSLS